MLSDFALVRLWSVLFDSCPYVLFRIFTCRSSLPMTQDWPMNALTQSRGCSLLLAVGVVNSGCLGHSAHISTAPSSPYIYSCPWIQSDNPKSTINLIVLLKYHRVHFQACSHALWTSLLPSAMQQGVTLDCVLSNFYKRLCAPKTVYPIQQHYSLIGYHFPSSHSAVIYFLSDTLVRRLSRNSKKSW